MKKALLLTAIIVLAGCAQIEPVTFQGPNGNTAYSMICSGMGRTWEACYQKAGELCPNGYDIVGQQSSTVIVPTAQGALGAPRQTLAIECKP